MAMITSFLADALEKSVRNVGWMLSGNFRRFQRLHLGQCSLQRKTWEELMSQVGAGGASARLPQGWPSAQLLRWTWSFASNQNASVPYSMPYCWIYCILFLSSLSSREPWLINFQGSRTFLEGILRHVPSVPQDEGPKTCCRWCWAQKMTLVTSGGFSSFGEWKKMLMLQAPTFGSSLGSYLWMVILNHYMIWCDFIIAFCHVLSVFPTFSKIPKLKETSPWAPGQFDHHMWWLGDLPSSRSCLSAVVEWEATPTHYGYNMI